MKSECRIPPRGERRKSTEPPLNRSKNTPLGLRHEVKVSLHENEGFIHPFLKDTILGLIRVETRTAQLNLRALCCQLV